MSAKPNQTKTRESRAKQASNAMSDIRNALYRRMVDFVLSNEGRLRDEILGEDSYSFTLQQLDEQFLNKLSIVDRAASELMRADSRDGVLMTTTYEAVEVIARREDLPQKIADALAEHGESDFLDMSVLRADDKHAEVLLVMAREDSGVPPTTPRPEQLERGEQGEQGEDHSDSAGGSDKK